MHDFWEKPGFLRPGLLLFAIGYQFPIPNSQLPIPNSQFPVF
ncbi:MAG: hypothetical protein U7126_03800 [Microcoleus sp.]